MDSGPFNSSRPHDSDLLSAIVHWVELLRTQRLLLRHWEEPDLPAFFDLYSRADVMRWLGPHPRLALTDLDNSASQAVAIRLGMRDEGVTQRWFGLITRQFRKVTTACS